MRRLLLALLAVALAAPAAAAPARSTRSRRSLPRSTRRSPGTTSRAIGKPFAGRLESGVQLPAEGRDFWTYDWGLKASPNRPWRRWGTNRLVRTLLDVLDAYRATNPGAPRVGIADLSRPHGGRFGAQLRRARPRLAPERARRRRPLPARDRLERRAHDPALVDRRLAQRLLDAFVAAGATDVFVGPPLGLRGPRDVVMELVHHDDHMHVRIR